MDETVAVIVASYGDKDYWDSLAKRALASVDKQTRPPDEVYRIHANSLHEARNSGGITVKTKHLCFLDCDDELEPNYLKEMMGPFRVPVELRYPRVRYVSENLVGPKYTPLPVTLPQKPIWKGNFMVIGTILRRDLFLHVGGFRDLPAYEDWDLWIRCWLVGAEPRCVPEAIYRVHRRIDSRNVVKNPHLIANQILQYNRQWNEERKRKNAKHGRESVGHDVPREVRPNLSWTGNSRLDDRGRNAMVTFSSKTNE